MNELLENFGFEGLEEVAIVFQKSLAEFEAYLAKHQKNPDLVDLKRESHRLKSALGNFGENETAALCEKMEHAPSVADAEEKIAACLLLIPQVQQRITSFLNEHRPRAT